MKTVLKIKVWKRQTMQQNVKWYKHTRWKIREKSTVHISDATISKQTKGMICIETYENSSNWLKLSPKNYSFNFVKSWLIACWLLTWKLTGGKVMEKGCILHVCDFYWPLEQSHLLCESHWERLATHALTVPWCLFHLLPTHSSA